MQSPFLLSIRDEIRLRGYSLKIEKTYFYWLRHFIYYFNKWHPKGMGGSEVKEFLIYLTAVKHVAINTQKVVLIALVFLYKKVLQKELGGLGFKLATKQRSIPIVLASSEGARIFTSH